MIRARGFDVEYRTRDGTKYIHLLIGRPYIILEGDFTFINLPDNVNFYSYEKELPSTNASGRRVQLFAVFDSEESRSSFVRSYGSEITGAEDFKLRYRVHPDYIELITDTGFTTPNVFRYGSMIPKLKRLTLFPKISELVSERVIDNENLRQRLLITLGQEHSNHQHLLRLYFLAKFLSRKCGEFRHVKELIATKLLAAKDSSVTSEMSYHLMLEYQGRRTVFTIQDHDWFGRVLTSGPHAIIEFLIGYRYSKIVRDDRWAKYLVLYHMFTSTCADFPDLIMDIGEDSSVRRFFTSLSQNT